jgi:hypothetical protein
MNTTMGSRLGIMLAVGLASGVGGQTSEGVPLYDNLGTHHYAVSTSVPLAQRYFDQGLRLYYAFNHEESIRAFAEAARLDGECAMCEWGVALAWGPNINLRWTRRRAWRRTRRSSERGRERSMGVPGSGR